MPAYPRSAEVPCWLFQERQAGTWTNISSSNKIQRNYKAVKIAMCIHSLDKLWTVGYKKNENPDAISKDPGEKAGYCTCTLHTAPPRGWADHLNHPSGPTPGPASPLAPYKAPAHLLSGSEQGNLLLVFDPFCCSKSPNKTLPEILIWLRINLYWLRKAGDRDQ